MKTKKFQSVVSLLIAFAGIVFIPGCDTTISGGSRFIFSDGSVLPMSGGSNNNKTVLKEYLVTYEAEGSFREGATYHLVKTDKGLAVFERAKDGGGILIENHWEDSNGDHFAAWDKYLGRYGYEFIIPKDQQQFVLFYVYPWGAYVLEKINGVERPVSSTPTEPVIMLISNKSDLVWGIYLRNAAREGDFEKVESISTEHPHVINAKNYKGNSPLLVAALNGHREAAMALINKGAEVNAANNEGNTSLTIAALRRHKGVVQLLISKGADVNVIDKNGKSILHYVAIKGYKDIAELLIAKGADVNVRDATSFTPLHYAIKNDHKDVAELLRKHRGVE